jgi:hypothetical protein
MSDCGDVCQAGCVASPPPSCRPYRCCHSPAHTHALLRLLRSFVCPDLLSTPRHLPCPEGFYCPYLEAGCNRNGTAFPCSPSPPGYYCLPGSTTSTGSPCPAGQFSPGGGVPCRPCAEGFYCPEGSVNATSFRCGTSSPPGWGCSPGSSNATG